MGFIVCKKALFKGQVINAATMRDGHTTLISSVFWRVINSSFTKLLAYLLSTPILQTTIDAFIYVKKSKYKLYLIITPTISNAP